jgi:polar amino acid transport system permease protein
VVAFAHGLRAGLALALACLSRFMMLRQAARPYVEVVRGIPIIVLLLVCGLRAGAGAGGGPVNWVPQRRLGLEPEWRTRDFPLLWRAIIALTIAYSAFLAEVFRAGLQSVDKGQIEAARGAGPERAGKALSPHRVSAGLPHHPAALWQ